MAKKCFIFLSVFFITTESFSQIYSTGIGDGYVNTCIIWGPNQVIPVNLLTFDAICSNNRAVINWSVASGSNNADYIIERSFDGGHFQQAGIVQANKTLSETHYYSFVDNVAAAGRLYYRIKQIKGNGQPDYSKVIAVSCKTDNTPVIIYPNPTQGLLTIITNQSQFSPQNFSLVVRNALGQQVFSAMEVSSKMSVNLSYLPQNLYFAEVKTASSVSYHKIVLNKN